MFKKSFVLALVAISLLLSGCSQADKVTVLEREKRNGEITTSTVEASNTISIYHQDGIVNKQVLNDVFVLVDGSADDLKAYKDYVDQSFGAEAFQVEGFDYKTELTDTSLSVITTFDYTKMNYDKLSMAAKVLFFADGLEDDNGKLPYDKLISHYTEDYDFAVKES